MDVTPTRMSHLGRLAEAAVSVAASCAYVATAARTVQAGDSGELAAMGAHGGVAHPPGYPLYLLWLRALSWLPATPTHRAALATGILGALAVGMLQAACRAWGARRSVSALASAAFAFSPLAWRLSTEPEVFSLNLLVALAIVFLSAPRVLAPAGEAWRVALLGLAAGLGIASHHSIVLIAPVGMYAAVTSARRTTSPVRAGFVGVAMLVVGLSPYLYLVHAGRSVTDSTCGWGDLTTLHGFIHHFLRRDYGTFQLHATSHFADPLAQEAYFWRTLLLDGLGFSLLAPLGAVAAIVRGGRRAITGPVVALVLAFFVCGPLFALLLKLPSAGVWGLIVRRFHLLPLALATLLGALGLESLLRGRPLHLEGAIVAIVPLVAVARAASTVPEVRAHQAPTTERYLRNVLELAPPNSILLASGDDVAGGLLYMRCALHARPDVEVITPGLLLTSWYWPRVSARLGFIVEHSVEKTPSGDHVLDASKLLAQLTATHRPILLDDWFAPGLDTRFPSYPIGPLIRVTESWESVPAPDALYALNEELYRSMALDERPPPRSTWAGVRYKMYARPWRVLTTAFERAGDTAKAEACRARVRALEPR